MICLDNQHLFFPPFCLLHLSSSMKHQFYDAVNNGDEKELAELIRRDHGFNVNMPNRDGVTLLHLACRIGADSVISLLIAHPNIDVNAKTDYGFTPFHLACYNGRTSCVCKMLKDSKVKVNEPNCYGYTPLSNAVYWSHFNVVKWMIASGREMHLGKPDIIGVAKTKGETKSETLMKRFKKNPVETRHQMRLEIGWYDEAAAEMFALMVFVSDGLLQTKNTTTTPSPAARFFSVASRLPLELQMVLCYRAVGSANEIIPGKEREMSFRELAVKL